MWSLLEFGSVISIIFLVVIYLVIGRVMDVSDEDPDLINIPIYVGFIGFGLFYLFGNGKLINEFLKQSFLDQTLKTVGVIFAYLLGGVLWSFYKFKNYIKIKVNEIKRKSYFTSTRQQEEIDYLLNISNKKTQIILWVTYWPVSITWTFFKFILGDIPDYIYNATEKVYKKFVKDILKENNLNIKDEDIRDTHNG